MGIYSHYTTPELHAMREQLMAQLHNPASVTGHGRSVTTRTPEQIRRELQDIAAELDSRAGVPQRRPIYVI